MPIQTKENIQIYYDTQGRPKTVMIPFKIFAQSLPKVERERLAALSKKTQESVYAVSDKDIIQAVKEVRSELFPKYYGQKALRLPNSDHRRNRLTPNETGFVTVTV